MIKKSLKIIIILSLHTLIKKLDRQRNNLLNKSLIKILKQEGKNIMNNISGRQKGKGFSSLNRKALKTSNQEANNNFLLEEKNFLINSFF